MSETTNNPNARTPVVRHASRHAGWTQDAAGDYYRTYYRELVARHASRAQRTSRLEEIKMERRRARREKWLKGIRSLASVLVSSEAIG